MENRKKDKSTNAVLSILRTMNRVLNAVDAEKSVVQSKKLEEIVAYDGWRSWPPGVHVSFLGGSV